MGQTIIVALCLPESYRSLASLLVSRLLSSDKTNTKSPRRLPNYLSWFLVIVHPAASKRLSVLGRADWPISQRRRATFSQGTKKEEDD